MSNENTTPNEAAATEENTTPEEKTTPSEKSAPEKKAAPAEKKAPADNNAAADLAKGAVTGAGALIKEFKEFISKGNVLDLAVGMIVGSAFTSIVTSLVEDIFLPFIGTILIGINFKNLGIRIPWGNNPFINFGSFLENVITFLLTAACLFIIIKTVNMFKRKEAEKPAEPPKPSNEEVLLTEIRDLLKEQNKK